MNEQRAADIRLPCARCGQPVVMPVAAASVPTGCERCTSGAVRGVAYTLRQGPLRLLLDHAAVVGRIESRELAGTDFIRSDDVHWLPVAEHPAFRQYFFPGAPRTAPPAASPTRSFAPALRAAAAFAGVGVVVVIAGYAWMNQREPVLPAPSAPPTAAAPTAPKPAVVAPDADTAMAGLVARVGAVPEARELLLAQAWSARLTGGAAGLQEAVRLAERAVVRVPDVETLATLAMLYAETRAEPDLRLSLLKRARYTNADHVAVVRAEVAEAITEARKDDARALVARCLQVDPKDTWCAAAAVDLTQDISPMDRMRAFDALSAKSQPGCGFLLRKSATAAIEALAPDAAKRVNLALKQLPGDPELTGYKAVLALRNGDLKLAIATARQLGEHAPARLRLDLAGHDIGAGNAASAREWLAPLAAQEPDDPEDRFWLHVHEAQADYLEALGNKDRMTGAADSADGVLAVRPHDPTAAQVRMLAALAAGDVQGARKAWGNADTKGLPGPDTAQLFLTAVELDLVGQVAREAMPQLESAQHADPASPDVWLWTARIALESSDPAMAIAAMRSAVRHVDGSAARRNPLAYALPRPADGARVETLFHTALDGAAGQEKGLAVSLATAEWLQGHDVRALEGIQRLLEDSTDPEALVLAARIHLAAGAPAVALPLVEAAAAAQPKEGEFALLRAQCLHALGRDNDAMKALEYVKGGAGVGASYHVLLGQMAGLGGGASRHAQEALAIDPYDEDAVRLDSAG